jgi:DNA-binding MarR family transcriptional regulator
MTVEFTEEQGMAEQPLSPGLQQFVESMGLYFEQFQLPRIGGRMLALLNIADHPLSLDDMAQRLGVSRASISTNVRLLVAAGMAEQVSLPGDRRDYYHVTASTWEHALIVNLDGIIALQRIAERALAQLAPGADDAAREHLVEMIDFCVFTTEDLRATLARWHARQAQRDTGA